MIITRIFNVGLCVALAVAASAFVKTNSGSSQIEGMEKEALLKQHNLYRSEVGAPDLEWDDELAAYAQKFKSFHNDLVFSFLQFKRVNIMYKI
ncbi:MAG: hypothetical protein R2780_01485 [Crocinitomicaceae bacterium]